MDSRRLLQEIRRYPVNFVPARKVVSIQPGEWTSPYEGKGYEPLGYRDFQIGDDPRRINLPATARRGEPTIVERVALRDFRIMVMVDRSASMRVREKLDTQLTAAALMLYSAWQSETTFGLAVHTDAGVRSLKMGVGSRHFYNLYRLLMELSADTGTEPVRGRRVSLSRCLPPNAMLLYCSDFLEPGGELVDVAGLWKSVRRYDFIPVVIQDELEYSFPVLSYGSFIPFSNPETGSRQEAWLSPQQTQRIRTVHEDRFAELTELWQSRGVRCLHLATPDVRSMARQVERYFRQRRSRNAA